MCQFLYPIQMYQSNLEFTNEKLYQTSVCNICKTNTYVNRHAKNRINQYCSAVIRLEFTLDNLRKTLII